MPNASAHPLETYLQGLHLWLHPVEPDSHQKACDFFERAAEGGFGQAQVRTGDCYRAGDGRPRNIEKAVFWYKQGVNGGEMQAYYALGTVYLLEYHDPKRYSEALALLRQAQQRHDAYASYPIGIAYHLGLGVAKDNQKAIENYRVAAAANYIYAQAALYEIYAQGLYGQRRDPQQAAYWKAAVARNPNVPLDTNGHWTVDRVLAQLYHEGFVFPKDDARAKALYELGQKKH